MTSKQINELAHAIFDEISEYIPFDLDGTTIRRQNVFSRIERCLVSFNRENQDSGEDGRRAYSAMKNRL